jgi:glycosyltransferase involved in cell wall biosynthesis
MTGTTVAAGSQPSEARTGRPDRQARVSIGVPVLNGERYLDACLDSLLAQTYRDVEILISDNASTDRTPEICHQYCQRDERVRYYRQPRNRGVAANYRFLVERATGEFFKWAAYDDVCAPQFVERCVAALDRSPSDVLAFPRTTFIDGAGEPLARIDGGVRWRNHPKSVGRLNDLLIDHTRSFAKWQFGVIRRHALLRTGLIRNYDASDLVLMAELALLGGFDRVDEPLFRLRIHEATSGVANASAHELANWYDPNHDDHHYPLDRTSVLMGYLGAVATSRLAFHEKVAGIGLVARWLFSDRQWRVVGGELKLRALGSARRRRHSRVVDPS